jgi:hypothetical protein
MRRQKLYLIPEAAASVAVMRRYCVGERVSVYATTVLAVADDGERRSRQ